MFFRDLSVKKLLPGHVDTEGVVLATDSKTLRAGSRGIAERKSDESACS